jgi:hypothetical protein
MSRVYQRRLHCPRELQLSINTQQNASFFLVLRINTSNICPKFVNDIKVEKNKNKNNELSFIT